MDDSIGILRQMLAGHEKHAALAEATGSREAEYHRNRCRALQAAIAALDVPPVMYLTHEGKHGEYSPAHTSEARDAVSIEGTVVFKRSAGAGKNCVCCDGDHVYGRNIAYDTRAKRPDDTALDELVRGVISKPENEGKRVRISIEIIAGANDAAMRQEAGQT